MSICKENVQKATSGSNCEPPFLHRYSAVFMEKCTAKTTWEAMHWMLVLPPKHYTYSACVGITYVKAWLLFAPSILLRSSTPWLCSFSETWSWHWWEDISTIQVQLQVTLVGFQMISEVVQSPGSLFQVVWHGTARICYYHLEQHLLCVIRNICWRTTLCCLIWSIWFI